MQQPMQQPMQQMNIEQVPINNTKEGFDFTAASIRHINHQHAIIVMVLIVIVLRIT